MKKSAHSGSNKHKSERKLPYLLILLGAILATLMFMSRVAIPHSDCANSESCISDLSGTYDPTAAAGVFLEEKVVVPSPAPEQIEHILGMSNANKRIEVDLTNQRLNAYDGDFLDHSFPISSGKWGKTPTGDFTIWIKLKYTRMRGGNKALGTYYDLPNVPFTMYFYNDKIPKYRGFGIHGAYWHNNFGHPMSHGCINLSPSDAEILFSWAAPVSSAHTTLATSENPGTPVRIFGVAPNE